MIMLLFCLSNCAPSEPLLLPEGQVYAPGIDPEGIAVSGLEVGHRLMAAGEYELALEAFNRAAVERGRLDAEILAGLGAANLGLGRLNQAEGLLRRATADPGATPQDWNNLGVVLMETDRTAEAAGVFRKAFALSNGENTAIRDNLRLALAKIENSATLDSENNKNYRLVRRSGSEFVLQTAP